MQPETSAKLDLWRQKCLDGSITKEELREALQILRYDRQNSAAPPKKSGAGGKKAAANVDSDALLSELEGL